MEGIAVNDFFLLLKTGFASEYAFLIKAQNFHWNVTGRNFSQDHALFERIYEEVGDIIDDFAENLRKSGTFAPATLAQLGDLSVIEDAPETPVNADDMYRALLADSDTMAELFAALFDLAETHHEHGLSNFMADRQDAHRKHSWMLRSAIGA